MTKYQIKVHRPNEHYRMHCILPTGIRSGGPASWAPMGMTALITTTFGAIVGRLNREKKCWSMFVAFPAVCVIFDGVRGQTGKRPRRGNRGQRSEYLSPSERNYGDWQGGRGESRRRYIPGEHAVGMWLVVNGVHSAK